MKTSNVCVVTGSRSEYGLLQQVMSFIAADSSLRLQVVVTGMHLSPEFGSTYRDIEADGFVIDEKVETLLSSDTHAGTAKSVGLGCIGFADVYQRLQPDAVVVLGDRYEIFAAVQTAFIMRVPVVHIAGGDVTVGAFDEGLRHSMTKMSALHFVTNEPSRKRVVHLGEDPNTVYNAGHPGIDRILGLPRLSQSAVEERLQFTLRSRNLLVTYHPVTLGNRSSKEELEEVLHALEQLEKDTGIIFTKPNADPNGRVLMQLMDKFTAAHDNAVAVTSLGQLYYFNLVRFVDAVVGNSSSGLTEVPSLHKPTVDIGDRQKGRLRGESVIHCEPYAKEIFLAIQKAWKLDCSGVSNPYGNGGSSVQIVRILKERLAEGIDVRKTFYEGGC
ncbi:UDP-N-acetylglucosamine 2-epimerase [Alicyclobacillus sp. SO9]|uniref:UDP-N-acetylglucosamine 2-epimerase n=1 Tax=Alicyclobacillus sp. SO9 TaxID=2665646 RepID=UPI0018E6F6E2|nr:UDP-N-acetylglucosamine 2-epimerase [Alicyclobacillus sp. SO9]QQE78263.1 UDP-N-acetylglucosamine 2-epimerase (hydrolyzing) [Alicyclobacillus sp. SO9]